MAGILVPPWKKSSSTTIVPRSTSITTVQGNTGTFTIQGASATSDGLTLKANTATFSENNTGVINMKDKLVFATSWTGTGSGGGAGSVDVSWIQITGTLTTALAVNRVAGLRHTGTVSYSVNQALSNSPAFLHDGIIQPTTSSTDTLTYWMSYNTTAKILPSGSSITPAVTELIGYSAAMKVYLGSGPTSISVTSVTSFASYYVLELFTNSFQSATLTNLYHFRTGNPLQNSSTLTNNIGLYIVNMNFGTNRYGVYSDLASGSANWFLYGTGTAQSAHSGKFYFGGTTAPSFHIHGGGSYGRVRTTVANTAYSAVSTDSLIVYTSLTAARTVTLEAAATAGAGRIIDIVDEAGTAGTNNITIDASGTEKIDGVLQSFIKNDYGSTRIYSNGSNWFSIVKPNPVVLQYRDPTETSISNSAAETTVATFTLAGGTIGSTRALRLKCVGHTKNNTGVNRTLTVKIKFGTDVMYNAVHTMVTDTNTRGIEINSTISASGATNSQEGSSWSILGAANTIGGVGGAVAEFLFAHYHGGAQDSTADITVTVTWQLSTASTNLTALAHTFQCELI